MMIDAEFLTGPLTTAATFARYPSVVTVDGNERKIPTITLVDVVCCDPQSEGCMALSATEGGTCGNHPTAFGHGCTNNGPCEC